MQVVQLSQILQVGVSTSSYSHRALSLWESLDSILYKFWICLNKISELIILICSTLYSVLHGKTYAFSYLYFYFILK